MANPLRKQKYALKKYYENKLRWGRKYCWLNSVADWQWRVNLRIHGLWEKREEVLLLPVVKEKRSTD